MLDIIRMVLLLLMLGITSYFDIKQREIADYWWLIFGAVGIGIYFFDWQEHTPYDGLTIIVMLVIAALLWRFYPIGKADVLAFVCIGILVPTMNEFVMVPIVLFAGGAIIAGVSVILYNIAINSKDGIIMKRDPFYTFDEPFIRKLLAFFMIHNKRSKEKFSICAEHTINGKKKFCFGIKSVESEFTKDSVFVEYATPILPCMFAAYILLIIISL